ncbi:universal stress protein [Streptomyces sp. NPDC097617]|uniref:universal stress protein n=1 Tax=Streptomyces sp. NPDC097617 TaxID=3366091 RepID=UPI00382AFABC
MSGLVIVGGDGPPSSLAAVETAAREARRRGAGLRVVHAFHWPVMPLGPIPQDPAERESTTRRSWWRTSGPAAPYTERPGPRRPAGAAPEPIAEGRGEPDPVPHPFKRGRARRRGVDAEDRGR